MHAAVLVVVPDGIVDVEGFVVDLLEPHRHRPDDFRHFDYATIGGNFDGQCLPGGAPKRRPYTIENNLCPIDKLNLSVAPCHALLLPDGTWDSGARFVENAATSDTGEQRWQAHVRASLAEYPEGAVVLVDAHS